jgi:methyl-accepting chemotaxis protein
MAIHDGSPAGLLRLVTRQLRRRLVWTFAPLLMVSLLLVAVAGYRAASAILRQQALQQLHARRVGAAREIERYFSGLEAQVVGLARDPSTVSALQQLRDATAELDVDPLTESARMRPQMQRLKNFLEEYYQGELRNHALDLRALLLPQRSAVWLQARYFTRGTDSTMEAAESDVQDATSYDRFHATWDRFFRRTLERFGFQDLYLIDAASARVVYSVRKRPDFQTSLLDGPYAASGAGVLFKELEKTGNTEAYRVVDVAPYPPLHEIPAAFAGASILSNGRRVGTLIVQLSTEPLTRLLSADGHWAQIGLGETGELYLVGSGDKDLLMRSEPRFNANVRGASSVLRQRVESQATSETNGDEFQSEYTSYRGVSVLGSVGRLTHLVGLDWTLVAEMTTAEALHPLTQLRTQAMWLTILLVLGSIVFILVVTPAVAAPVRALVKRAVATGGRVDEYKRRLESDLRPVLAAAAAASEGDLSQRVAVDGSLLGDLPRTLNRMWRSVGALVSHAQITTTAAVESATQIQNVVRQLSHDAVQHTSEIATTNALLRDTRAHLEALVAAAVAASPDPSSDVPVPPDPDAAAEAVAGMEALQSHTHALTMKMKRLGERSMEISTVMTTIQQVTAEANMLALNATIEASRAGEHGLGFKTVANDIRKLATRTEAVTRDLGELVTTMHSEAADAVDGIDQQADQIERQVKLIARLDHTPDRSPDSGVENGDVLSTLSATASEQARAAERLSDAMLRVAEFVRRTHVLSEQTVHSTAALLRMLSELSTWAQTFRAPAGRTNPTASADRAKVIELTADETVGNGHGAGAQRQTT